MHTNSAQYLAASAYGSSLFVRSTCLMSVFRLIMRLFIASGILFEGVKWVPPA